MRALIGSDLFTALRIVRAAGLEDEVKKITSDISSGKQVSQKDVGIELIITCICGCASPSAEKEIWKFLGDITEIPAEELKGMEITELMNVLEELMRHVSSYDFKSFFLQLSRLMRTKSLK